MNQEQSELRSQIRNPYKEIIHVLLESTRECQQCQALKDKENSSQNELEQLKQVIQNQRNEFEEYMNTTSVELKEKTLKYNNDTIKLSEFYNDKIFQLKEKYEKQLINKEGTQYSINLLNQSLQRRQEYLEKLRSMLQRKENQLLDSKEQYLINLKKIKSNEEFDIDTEYQNELQSLKKIYQESVKDHEDQKLIEIKLIQEELKDSIIERDYYIRKFRDRLNEKEEFNRNIYESQCQQIQNIIQINQLEQQLIESKSTISQTVLQDLILKNGSSIFWKEGLENYKKYNVHDIESILFDIKEKELKHSQYLTKRFQSITRSAIVISRYQKQFEFMKKLIEGQQHQEQKWEEFEKQKQEKVDIYKKNSIQFYSQDQLIEETDNLKQFYSSLGDLKILQERNEKVVNDKLVEIFKLQQVNKELQQQTKQLYINLEQQKKEKEYLSHQISKKQNKLTEMSNFVDNESKQFSLMIELKKLELQDLISMNQKQIQIKDDEITKLCKDLEYLQNMLNQRPSRDEDLQKILNLTTDLQIKTEKFEQLQLYVKSKEGLQNNSLQLNGEMLYVENTFQQMYSKQNPIDQNSKISQEHIKKQNDSLSYSQPNPKTIPKENKIFIQKCSMMNYLDEVDLTPILQHQKLFTKSTTPKLLDKKQRNKRIETDFNRKNKTQQSPISDIQLENKKNNFNQHENNLESIHKRDLSKSNMSTKNTKSGNEYQWIESLKKDIESHFHGSNDNSNNNEIFIKKTNIQQSRSQTPQGIRTRIISNRKNSQLNVSSLVTKKQLPDINSKQLPLQNHEDYNILNQINNNFTQSSPFIFKVKKEYSKLQTIQQNTIKD